MQDKKRVENFWREPPRGLFIHFVLLIKKRRLKSSQKKSNFLGSLHLRYLFCLEDYFARKKEDFL